MHHLEGRPAFFLPFRNAKLRDQPSFVRQLPANSGGKFPEWEKTRTKEYLLYGGARQKEDAEGETDTKQ